MEPVVRKIRLKVIVRFVAPDSPENCGANKGKAMKPLSKL